MGKSLNEKPSMKLNKNKNYQNITNMVSSKKHMIYCISVATFRELFLFE